VYPISDDITHNAVSFYKTQTSKKESLFDCYVMAAAKKLAADCIFSFDKGYVKNGFVLSTLTQHVECSCAAHPSSTAPVIDNAARAGWLHM
jgi:hypothetical protein